MAARWAGLIFPKYLYRKLKKSSCQKPLDRFPYNFAEMFLWWPSTKILQAIWICQKIWPPVGRGSFSLYIYIENFKNLLVRNHWTNCYIILQKYSFGDSVLRLFKPFWFVKKHGRQVGGAYFPYIIYIENFKNVLVRNHWTDFNIMLQKCSLVILYQDCSSHLDSSKNMAARGWGLFSLYIYIETFKNLLVRNH